MFRGASKVAVSIFMIGAVLVASTIYAYLASGLLTTYVPSEQAVSRIGDVEVELRSVDRYGYDFYASVKLVNLGSQRYTLSSVQVALLVAGTTGRSKIVYCTGDQVDLEPGSVTEVRAACILSRYEMRVLFGTSAPPFDLVKKNVKFMFMKMLLPPLCPSPGACNHSTITNNSVLERLRQAPSHAPQPCEHLSA